MVKFNKSLNDFSYIIGFDLALYHTGVCVYDIANKTIVDTFKVDVHKKSEKPVVDLFKAINECLANIENKYKGNKIVTKEALPQQAGKFTQISTLQGLAKAHAILELCISQFEDIENYDNSGVHSISVKAIFRSESLPKPQKHDIASAVGKIYQLDVSCLTEDITDSIAVVHTLMVKKWNQDIDAEVKEIKKEIKSLKAEKTIIARQERVEFLLNNKI